MIIWLASYPKSGNTLIRSILSSYFFSNKAEFTFENLSKITQFPRITHFQKIGVDISNMEEIFYNFINAQNLINKNKKSIKFFKTHSSFYNNDEIKFTDLNNTLGVIYIVRDPRNVATSFAYHYNLSIEDAANIMINKKDFRIKTPDNLSVIVGSWDVNYNSWKKFDPDKVLIIKYEDLVSKKKNIIEVIFKFLGKLGLGKLELDNAKLANLIHTTDFSKMKNLEIQEGFKEAVMEGEKPKRFFNLGPDNKWQNLLDDKIRSKIENAFQEEMSELGYI